MENPTEHSEADNEDNTPEKSILVKVTDQLLSLQDEKGMLKGTESTLGGYVVELQQDDPCCPLCYRGFEVVVESSELVLKLEEKMQVLSLLIAEKEAELEQLLEHFLDSTLWRKRDHGTFINSEPDDFPTSLYPVDYSSSNERSLSPEQSLFSTVDSDLYLDQLNVEDSEEPQDEDMFKLGTSQPDLQNSQGQKLDTPLIEDTSQASNPTAELLPLNVGLRILEPQGSPTFKCFICGGHYLNKTFFDIHLQKHEEPSLKLKKKALKKAIALNANRNRSNETSPDNSPLCKKPVVNIIKCILNSGAEKGQYKQNEKAIASSGHHESLSDTSVNKDLLLLGDDSVKLKLLNLPTYTCTECDKGFSERRYVIRHYKTVHQKPKKTYTCGVCNQEFNSKQFLRQHKKLHIKTKIVHKNLKHFICSVCNTDFSSKKFLCQHLRTHKEAKPFLCEECGRTFGNNFNLVKHTMAHLTKKDKVFTFDECGEQFKHRYQLEKHEDVHENIQNRYTCSICSKTLSSLYHLTSHQFLHTGEAPFTCEVCDKKYTRKECLRSHMLTHQEGKFHCDICEKVFQTERALGIHRSVHEKGKQDRYFCKICKKGFSKKKSVIEHNLLHNEVHHICDYCNRGFTQKSHLKKHIEVVHKGIRRHICSFCRKAFSTNRNLIEHELTHNPQAKLLTCGTCMQTFDSKYQLAKHMKNHSLSKDTT